MRARNELGPGVWKDLRLAAGDKLRRRAGRERRPWIGQVPGGGGRGGPLEWRRAEMVREGGRTRSKRGHAFGALRCKWKMQIPRRLCARRPSGPPARRPLCAGHFRRHLFRPISGELTMRRNLLPLEMHNKASAELDESPLVVELELRARRPSRLAAKQSGPSAAAAAAAAAAANWALSDHSSQRLEQDSASSAACDLSQRWLPARNRSQLCFWFRLAAEQTGPLVASSSGPAGERLVEAELHLFKLAPELGFGRTGEARPTLRTNLLEVSARAAEWAPIKPNLHYANLASSSSSSSSAAAATQTR